MKYIIKESKLNETIKNYLNSVYPVDKMHWTPAFDDDLNEMDSAIEFYISDEDEDDTETVFRWYDKEYWNEQIDELSPSQEYDRKLLKKYKNDSPILEFENSNVSRSLNGYFGDSWKQPFKEWFYDNFGFIIKTFHE
jgi:hypothetical protein